MSDPAARDDSRHGVGSLDLLGKTLFPSRLLTDDMLGVGGEPREEDLPVTRPIHLEVFENFSQLCIVVNIVKVIPGSSLLLSAVTVVDKVVRLFQDWLQDAVRRREHLENHNDPYSGGTTEDSHTDSRMDGSQMLWADEARNVGMKVRVRERREASETAPILVHRDEEPATSFDLAIEGTFAETLPVLSLGPCC